MLTYGQSILLGLLQGLTELFPISSLGHTVLLPSLLGWQLDQHAEFFVVFLVATHLATALVLLAFYYRDWLAIARGFFRTIGARRIPAGDVYAKLAWLLIVATIPAGALGLLFHEKLEAFFGAPAEVALFLIANGVLLYGAERLRRVRPVGQASEADTTLATLSFPQALGIGFAQALALFPGFSRTGATIAGGLLAGLSHTSSVRFSFLMATPIISAAAVLKLPHLLHVEQDVLWVTLVGTIASAAAAYLAVRYLTRYFKTHTLTPFAIYCVLIGVVAFVALR
jgi:undecaprenyl-diphosphatase